MNRNTQTQKGLGQSAKIYQFPVGGHRALSAHRESGHRESGHREPGHREVGSAAEQAAMRISNAVVSGCWYHDEAIQQATAPAKS